MPLEFVTNSILPSEEAQGATGAQSSGKKRCCSGRKPAGDNRDKTSAVNQAGLRLYVWYNSMEGLFYLIALLLFKACPGHAFLFAIPCSRRCQDGGLSNSAQESGRQRKKRFIEYDYKRRDYEHSNPF
jgi:hypothetical protein